MVTNSLINVNSPDPSKIDRAFYFVKSDETGQVRLRNRKIAKALRWWLRENGLTYSSTFLII